MGPIQISSFFSWICFMIISNGSISTLPLVLELKDSERRVIYPFFFFQGFVKFHTSRILSDWQWSRYGWTNVSCNMIGQWYLKGQSNDAIHNRYIITKTTQERLLKHTLHTWSSSFSITLTETRKRSILIKTGTKFCTKTNARLWRRCTAIYAPFFQIMRLWRRARGYPNPC